jgi:hypothetical protein
MARRASTAASRAGHGVAEQQTEFSVRVDDRSD